MLVFEVLFVAIRCSTRSRQQSLSSVVLFTMMIWYTSILQMIGSFYDCYEDPERQQYDEGNKEDVPGYYLVSDPNVLCNPTRSDLKPWRILVHINSAVISIIVGVGFFIV